MASSEPHKKKKSPKRLERLEAKVRESIEEETSLRAQAEKDLIRLKELIAQQELREKQAAAGLMAHAHAQLAHVKRLAAEQDAARAARRAQDAAARRVRRELALAEARAEREAKARQKAELAAAQAAAPAAAAASEAYDEALLLQEDLAKLISDLGEPPAEEQPAEEPEVAEEAAAAVAQPMPANEGASLLDESGEESDLLQQAEDILASSRRQRQVMGGIRWADREGGELREVRQYRRSSAPPEQQPEPAVAPGARTPPGCTTAWKTKVCGHPLANGRGTCKLKTKLTKHCWIHTTRDTGARPSDSAIAGKGLIAMRDLPTGTNIPYGGKMMSKAHLNRICPSPYTAEYAVKYARNKVIDARESDTRGPGAYANDPRGTGKRANAKLSIDTRNQRANVKLTKNVKRGEEVLVHYDPEGDEYWGGAQFRRRGRR